MISLARHIEILLLEHECVIIPGFGGFLTKYMEAQIPCADNATLTPPYRTITFNQSLQSNDGLLIQSYMQAYDAAYPQASKQMQMDIEEMDAELKINGSYILSNIGKLTIDLNHRITFKPAIATLATPQLYSLPSVPMLSLEQAEKEAELKQALQQTAGSTLVMMGKPKAEKPQTDNDSSKDRQSNVVAIQRRWVDIAISAAAAVVLFFAIAYSSLHQNATNTPVVVSSASIKVPDSVSACSVSGKDNGKKADTLPATLDTSATPDNTGNVSQASSAKTFTIVLASGVKKVNAEDYIGWLSRNDLKEARFVNDGKMNRVVYGSYATQEAAIEALIQLRKQSSEFKSSWVIELPETNN